MEANAQFLIDEQIKLLLRELLIEKIEAGIAHRLRQRYPQFQFDILRLNDHKVIHDGKVYQ